MSHVPDVTEDSFTNGTWCCGPLSQILAEFLVVAPVLQLALLGAVGHQVTAATSGELPSQAIRTAALEDACGMFLDVHHLAEAVGTPCTLQNPRV